MCPVPTLLQISLEVIQYPLSIAPEGSQYPLASYQKVAETLTKLSHLQKLHNHLSNFVQRFAHMVTNLSRVASPVPADPPFDKFARGLSKAFETFVRGLA